MVPALAELDSAEWDRLAGSNPFLRHAFLSGLEETGCATADAGWTPHHVTIRRDGTLVAAAPLYLKDHSYGEYVFDWAWADAYQRHGLSYYPKLLCAVPFTPITGARLLAQSAADRALLLETVLGLAAQSSASSLHVLFPPRDQAEEFARQGMLLRRGVQFHWTNPGYADFEQFLAALSRDKRKKIRQERRRVREEGISFRWLTGREATEADWAFFARCYRTTYRQHRSTPYLNLHFFLHLARYMPEQVLLIEARRGDKPIAATFNVLGGDALYGRNWGAIEFVPLLHFEACYYQTIEYCIAHRIERFEGGAQGEHKMARGLMPVETVSAHWVAHREFRRAIGDYLARETRGIAEYVDELNDRSPFTPPDPLRNA